MTMTEETLPQEPETITIPASHNTTVNPDDLSPGEAKSMIDTLRASPAMYDTGDARHAETKASLERLYGAAYPGEDEVPSSIDQAAEQAFAPVGDPDRIDMTRLDWAEGEPYDHEVEQTARGWAVDAGFSQPEIDGMLTGISTHQRLSEEQRDRAYHTTLHSLQDEWGADHDANVSSVVDYAKSIGGEPLIDFMIGTGLANNHNFLTTALRHAKAKGF